MKQKQEQCQRRSQILLLGDSLTQLSMSAKECGWGAHIADVYQRRCDVVNRGMSGYNTDWFLLYAKSSSGNIFPTTTTTEINNTNDNVRLIIIFFGANDSADEELNRRQHVPIDKFKSNLNEIIDLCNKHYSNGKIIIIGCPPVVHKQRLEYQIQRYGKDNATGKLERTMTLSKLYSQTAEDVAASKNIPCLNLWKAMQSEAPEEAWHDFFFDGLHFSPNGNEFFGKALIKKINDSYPELKVSPDPITNQYANSGSKCDQLLEDGPWHDCIDHTNPSLAFSSYHSPQQQQEIESGADDEQQKKKKQKVDSVGEELPN